MFQFNNIFTIGHSTHTIQEFIGLLLRHHIECVVDVRSAPYSRWQPQFNRDALERSVRNAGIEYLFLGKELGARSEDPCCYRNGQVQYDLISQTDLFMSGIRRVREEYTSKRLALMCAEKEPLECHRTLLVSRALSRQGYGISHILADGSLESGEDATDRLLKLWKMQEASLFDSRDDLIEMASKKQEAIIAYKTETVGTEK